MNAVPIVFDLDGTLIDSAPDLCAIANGVLEEIGAKVVSLPEARSFVGHGADTLVRRMRAARDLPDADHDTLMARYVEHYEGQVAHSVDYPGVLDALTVLATRGHRLGI